MTQKLGGCVSAMPNIEEVTKGMYFRRDGTPCASILEPGLDFKNMDLRRVAATELWWGGWVSTVWLGINHNWFGGKPLIFETMLFGPGGNGDYDMDRYSTEAEAKEGHERMVKLWRFRIHKIAWIYLCMVLDKFKRRIA